MTTNNPYYEKMHAVVLFYLSSTTEAPSRVGMFTLDSTTQEMAPATQRALKAAAIRGERIEIVATGITHVAATMLRRRLYVKHPTIDQPRSKKTTPAVTLQKGSLKKAAIFRVTTHEGEYTVTRARATFLPEVKHYENPILPLRA